MHTLWIWLLYYAQVGGPLHPPWKSSATHPIKSSVTAPAKAADRSTPHSASTHGCGKHVWRGGLLLSLLGHVSKWVWDSSWAWMQWVQGAAAQLIRREEMPAAWEAVQVSEQSRRLHFQGAPWERLPVRRIGLDHDEIKIR